ncbi:MAG: type II toxin-antitoxin system RelE/ParE family toxin [Actinomycetota bacterium]|nr:type II toxin-antitoxin system RelE/ParE family toxin [Actinomycetota bacterium]
MEALGLLERDPEAGHALRGRLGGLRSLRFGSYRVIYQLDDSHRVVRVLAVRHRAQQRSKGLAGERTSTSAGNSVVYDATGDELP